MKKNKTWLIIYIIIMTFITMSYRTKNIFHATGDALIMGDGIINTGIWLGSMALCIVVWIYPKEKKDE